MSDRLAEQQAFKLVKPLRLKYDRSLETVASNSLGWTAQIQISECDLDVDQARKLRDWLNEVLP